MDVQYDVSRITAYFESNRGRHSLQSFPCAYCSDNPYYNSHTYIHIIHGRNSCCYLFSGYLSNSRYMGRYVLRGQGAGSWEAATSGETSDLLRYHIGQRRTAECQILTTSTNPSPTNTSISVGIFHPRSVARLRPGVRN